MLTWLADTLRDAGLPVVELDGWATRGKPKIRPQGIVIHHTATGPTVADRTVEKLLQIGRPDLAGPLSQLGLRRDGTWVVVAAGRANHNGYGQWGNDSIGIEAYNDGRGEPWPKQQLKSYEAGVAALCRRMGFGPERVKGHKETDPARKIDPTFDMDVFRNGVATALNPPPPTPEPVPVLEEFPMELLFDKTTFQTWALFPDGTCFEVNTAAHIPFFCPPGQEFDGPIKQSHAMASFVAKYLTSR